MKIEMDADVFVRHINELHRYSDDYRKYVEAVGSVLMLPGTYSLHSVAGEVQKRLDELRDKVSELKKQVAERDKPRMVVEVESHEWEGVQEERDAFAEENTGLRYKVEELDGLRAQLDKAEKIPEHVLLNQSVYLATNLLGLLARTRSHDNGDWFFMLRNKCIEMIVDSKWAYEGNNFEDKIPTGNLAEISDWFDEFPSESKAAAVMLTDLRKKLAEAQKDSRRLDEYDQNPQMIGWGSWDGKKHYWHTGAGSARLKTLREAIDVAVAEKEEKADE